MEVVGIGLANIDLFAYVSDNFLLQHKIPKKRAKVFNDLDFGRLRADLDKFDAVPGGCAANTMCGLSAIGGVPTAFIGKIGNDSFESLYRSSFNEYTVSYKTAPAQQESSQCAVLITPDGEHSFAYTHGASWDLDINDIDPSLLSKARMIYTEVYIFDFGKDNGPARLTFETAQKYNVPIAMKIMDAECGRKYMQKIRALADAGILTLIIGNQENLTLSLGVPSYEEALEIFKDWPCEVLMTANKDGSYLVSNGTVTYYPIKALPNPKNATGAGDQFVAGFLTGRLDNKPIAECMEYAASCARMILGHDTPRPPLVNRHSISF